MAKLVHYCPGSAVGSPAWLSPHAADEHLVRDTRYVQTMEGVGAMPAPVVYPHIGPCPATCKHYRPDTYSARD